MPCPLPRPMSSSRDRNGSTMKNVLGKIFVFGVFVMSLMLMSFAVAIYSSHVNWQEVAKKKQEDLDKLKACLLYTSPSPRDS